MSDALPDTENAARSGEGVDPDFLAYDFFKSFTSLCMITLGGVLTLAESVFGRQFDAWHIVAVSVPVALAGLFALQCQTDLVQQAKGVKPRSGFPLKHGLRLIPALYGGGVGVFLVVLFSSYLHQAGQ